MAAPNASSRCSSNRTPIPPRWLATNLCCLPKSRSAGWGWTGREVVAFAGIARPEKFYATLRRVGAQLVATRDFPDHHPYTPREVEALIEEAGRRGALLATTEKDATRLTARQARAVMILPVTL